MKSSLRSMWKPLVCTVLGLALPPMVRALGEERLVAVAPVSQGFALAEAGLVAPVYVDRADWPGVLRATASFRGDLARVTGATPEAPESRPAGSRAVLVGTLGRSAWVDTLVSAGKIDVSAIRGKWEAGLVQVVDQPWAGLDQALVIIGSDKRGTIFGLYGLSEQIGVSPWNWWADVPVRRAQSLWVQPGAHVRAEPVVQYRGIFLNDEAPALTNWAAQKFGGYNREFYARIFELLLRLRANYLWPAMWNSAFNEDDPANPQLADEFGIVMGTSHHEPMIRSQQEWKRNGTGAWDYHHNEEGLKRFWAEGVRRNRAYESLVTLGMRGDGDEPMSESENVALLEKIVRDQREILRQEVNPDVTKIPQVWALYKEVQGYYERGMRVPDDVVLLWCDDNWGNLRRLPTPQEEARSGGAGVYYHFDYVGGPRSYKWLNTNPLPKVWQQMEQAWRRKANRIWIVNVGDLKLMEFPTEFFLTLARDPGAWPYERLGEYTRLWAARDFGPEVADEVSALVEGYARINGRRKPELLAPETLSLVNYDEAARLVEEYQALVERAQSLRARIAPEALDAYFQLVEFPVRACAQVLRLHVASARTRLYGEQGRASTNEWADQAEHLFGADAELSHHFHTAVAGGKWNHIASQTHLGYTYWQQPPRNVMPPVQRTHVPDTADWAFTVEGTTGCWPTDNIHLHPPTTRPLERGGVEERWIEAFRQGSRPVRISVETAEPWLRLDRPELNLGPDARVFVSVDWHQAPAGRSTGTVILRSEGRELRIRIPVVNETIQGPAGGALEADGVVAIESGDFVSSASASGIEWRILRGLGRAREGLTTYPSEAASSEPTRLDSFVEYAFYVREAGKATVKWVLEPGLDHQPGAARFGASLDGETPAILDACPRGPAWDKAVSDAAHVVRQSVEFKSAGWHTVRFWRVDPGVVLQRVIIDRGGERPSYLGAPASQRLRP